MQKNSGNFSYADAMKLANSDAGKKLLGLLQQSDPQVLHQAMTHVQSGEYEKAKQTLAALMSTEEAKAVLEQKEG